MPKVRTPRPLDIQQVLANPKTHALGLELMDADLAGNGNGAFEYREAKHLDAAGRAAYAKLIGAQADQAPAADAPVVAPSKPAKTAAALTKLESPALRELVASYLADHPKETTAIEAFFAARGPLPAQAGLVNGRARSELFADASLIVRGQETVDGQKFPSKGLGKLIDQWLSDSITNTGSARQLDDPAYPRDFVRVASWIAGRGIDALPPPPAALSPAGQSLVKVFAMVEDPQLTDAVHAYLSAHPDEVPALATFFQAQGVPHGASALHNDKRLALYADAMMLLRQQGTTVEGVGFPSKGLGQVIASWIDEQFTNTGSAGPSSPLYPWKMVKVAEWLVKGAYAKQSDDFWNAMAPHLR